MENRNKQSGFTLIEIAVVLVIVGILIGSFIGTFADRIETTRRDNTKKQIEEIQFAILGFASAKGRLPCPSTATSTGQEQPLGGGACTVQHGFVPVATMGLSGAVNRDGLLIDSWGNPVRYSVTASAAYAFTKSGAGGIKDTGMAALTPDLVICSGDSTSGTDCAGGPRKLADNAAFVVLSLGKDGNEFVTNLVPDTDQGENSSEAVVAANAAGENLAYTVADNRVFVSKSYSDIASTAGRFDDIIVWVSPYILYSWMIEAGQLP
jgi:prepilin-type N-terminal cleavage/methylation domain-containing protein